MKKTLTLLVSLAALGAVLLASASPGSAVTAQAARSKITKVGVKDDFFQPAPVKIRKGGTVRWVWRGFNEHDVHVAGKRSKAKFRGTFSHRFLKPGRYHVFCAIHADVGMTMTVVVTK
jgi:plastocyanin